MGVSKQLMAVFQKQSEFTLGNAYEALPDVPQHSIRARIYDGLKNGQFVRLSRGVYAVAYQNNDGTENTCLLLHGDGRNLSFLPDESVDCIITDHPYFLPGQLKGGNRDFASYDLFQYTMKDLQEKFRVLKPGCFLAEFLPEESAENFEYLTRIKQMAIDAGFQYYAKVPWMKEGFFANTGRKSKNTEDILLFSRGRARPMRPDAKKDKADPETRHYMSGAAGMLPAQFIYPPPSRKDRTHQAEKPVNLLRKLLRYITFPGELVLDQFAGSGSLGAACALEHRNSILVEKDTGFVNAIVNRLRMEPIPVTG